MIKSVDEAYQVISDWFAEYEEKLGRPLTRQERKDLILRVCKTHGIDFD